MSKKNEIEVGAAKPTKVDTDIITKDSVNIQGVLKQVGTVNISKSHRNNYRLEDPTLELLLTHNVTPAVFKNDTRHGGADNVEKMLNYMLIDHDGTLEELLLLRERLQEINISYIEWASPSRKSKLALGLFKTRLMIPTIGLTKGLYPNQFLELMTVLGMNIDIKTDTTAKEVTRFFYPACMTGIKEPKTKVDVVDKDGKKTGRKGWKTLNPKPRDQTIKYAKDSVITFLGEPYKAKKRFTIVEREAIEEKRKYAYSSKESMYLPDELIITHLGEEIGTAKELFDSGSHVRCDCPFDGKHGTSSKEDAAFISSGHLLCSSNTHGHLIGRPEDAEIIFLDIEDEDEEVL